MIDIPGYEGKYMINTDGDIFSKYLGKNMSTWLANGYPRVRLCKDAKVKNFFVHQLVARSYIDNPENKPCINHINGVKSDNRVENLEWVTYQENSSHAIDIGLIKFRGEINNKSKLTEGQVLEIRDLLKNRTISYKRIGERFGVTRHAISRIDKGITWRHL